MRRVVALVLSGMVSTSVVRAQEKAAADFSPLEFLVGHCWTGSFGDGKATDEHCFEWKYDRHFIHDHHVVRGPDGTRLYEGETLYGWNPATRQIAWRYVSIDGLMMDGTLHLEGDDLVFPASYPTSGGIREVKAVWTRRPDGYVAVNNEKTATGWAQQFRVEFRRTR